MYVLYDFAYWLKIRCTDLGFIPELQKETVRKMKKTHGGKLTELSIQLDAPSSPLDLVSDTHFWKTDVASQTTVSSGCFSLSVLFLGGKTPTSALWRI